MTQNASLSTPEIAIELAGNAATLRLAGAWTTRRLHELERALARLSWPSGGAVELDGNDIDALDTAGAWLLGRLVRELEGRGCRPRVARLHARHRELLERVQALGELETPAPRPPGALARLGQAVVQAAGGGFELAALVGESTFALLRGLLHPTRLGLRSALRELETAGFRALPIIGLLAFLIGVVIAYQGGSQLRLYGANIFIVDLVTLTTVRELGPLLAAIIVAGRTGSAYAAHIGTMRVSEEIDALRSMGVDPVALLVVPRVIALVIALPLLTVFADVAAVAGGMVMAATLLGIGPGTFIERVPEAISLTSFLLGVGKAPVFAAILAVVGCHQGFQAAGSAESVGTRTTTAVVQGIFFVIVADAAFSIMFSVLGI